jgi:hypothetical protein
MCWAKTLAGGFDSHALPPYIPIKSNAYIKNIPNISQHMYYGVSGKTLRFPQALNEIQNSEQEKDQVFNSPPLLSFIF